MAREDGFTKNLNAWITCPCGRKGPHDPTKDCPIEGTSIFDTNLLDKLDLDLMRLRYDADPVISAVFDHLISMQQALRSISVVHDFTVTFTQTERTKMEKALSQKTIKLRDEELRSERFAQDNAIAAKANAELTERLKRLKAMFEEVAVATGYWKGPQDKDAATALAAAEVLRDRGADIETLLQNPFIEPTVQKEIDRLNNDGIPPAIAEWMQKTGYEEAVIVNKKTGEEMGMQFLNDYRWHPQANIPVPADENLEVRYHRRSSKNLAPGDGIVMKGKNGDDVMLDGGAPSAIRADSDRVDITRDYLWDAQYNDVYTFGDRGLALTERNRKEWAK